MATLFTAPYSAAVTTAVPAKSPLLLLHRLPANLIPSSFFLPPVKLNHLSSLKLFSIPLNGKQSQQNFNYPDPDPKFAISETKKFKIELAKKLLMEKGTYGNEVESVVDVCSEIFHDFLLTEYGGPGTLLVEPFTNMMVALKEKNLPGAPLAARASLIWAQKNLDQDWDVWNSQCS